MSVSALDVRNIQTITRTLAIVLLCLLMVSIVSSPVRAQNSLFNRLVGKWREINSATTVIIEADGRVFSQGGPVFGVVRSGEIDGGGNFAFENTKSRCVYDIAFLETGGASWGLRYESGSGSCYKTGLFFKYERDSAELQAEQDQAKANIASKARSKGEYDTRETREKLDALNDMNGVDLVYFDRSADDGAIMKLLQASNIAFSTRQSSESTKSNAITCTPDVPLRAIKTLARLMIKNNIAIRVITPSLYPELRMRMTVESYGGYVTSNAILTEAAIDKMTSCSLGEDIQKKSSNIIVKNDCSKTDIDVYVLHQNGASNFVIASEIGETINYKQSVKIKDDSNAEVVTAGRFIYYWAIGEGVNPPITWSGDVGKDHRVYNVLGRGKKIFRKSADINPVLVCK
ncbi:hypothetical protein SAMN02799631_00642 [Methylobacterium sp. 174MFSha1.1]|uniref:hypothetical protein n=1 Tax=Methylobacterium sp. 174MFSha1.1 TaxID=1502749 RepID=UPI0008F38A4C|nr:hypothetical protein [Methylobacterium sp. 174MFSha1.1]SFU42789.1 hypothetical protein SAMN02799631_00642 [Methylobacterium sp. 174MFSha1.1]